MYARSRIVVIDSNIRRAFVGIHDEVAGCLVKTCVSALGGPDRRG